MAKVKSFGLETSKLKITHHNGAITEMTVKELESSYPRLAQIVNTQRLMLTVYGDQLVLIRLNEDGGVHSFFKKTSKNTIDFLNSITPYWDWDYPIKEVFIIKE
jgi:hypothetical protein